jgi:hypothetical protein
LLRVSTSIMSRIINENTGLLNKLVQIFYDVYRNDEKTLKTIQRQYFLTNKGYFLFLFVPVQTFYTDCVEIQ